MESTSQRTAPLLNMTGMEEEVLWYHVVLQDDNTRLHWARIVQKFMQQNNVDNLDWPARSLDLSPIEHVWDILGQRVRQRVPQPRTLQVLGAALQEEWRRIPQLQIARLIRSMHRCNRRTYAILTDLLGFIGDPSNLPHKFSHSHLVLQTPTDGFLSVNEMM